MQITLAELLTNYVIGGAFIIGATTSIFLIAFMPAFQSTKALIAGYKNHQNHGDSSIYTVNRNT